jgi:hypothetical protein
MRTCLLWSSVVLLGLACSACATGQAVSTRTLLAQMTDLAGMAEFPDPPYTCRQFSSYDQTSTTPDDAKTWFANGDCDQYLRVEDREGRKEYVMADMAGPGAIVRIWSANPKGTLRIYLDGNEQAVLTAPMADLLVGKVLGIPAPIAHERSAGWNCYFPFPYAKHCKVTSDERGFYYHVNYRTYPVGTKVETFQEAQLEALAADTFQVAARLAYPRAGSLVKPDAAPKATSFGLKRMHKGETEHVELKGPGVITELKLKVTAPDVPLALRQTVLRIGFDGESTVDVPLGDFFGAAPGINPYTSLPLGVNADGEMWCHWVMPFKQGAIIDISNLGEQTVSLEGSLLQSTYKWTDRSMHFQAHWHTQFDVPTRPMQDWNYVSMKGKGVFAGVAFAIANPSKSWWGEGDEKIYVDGETFPSHFGTGTEDYYGYAWCCPTPFTHAYHNQPRCDGPANYGHTAVNRWHIIDRIPFEKDFRFDMEIWHWWEGIVPQISVVSYCYAKPGATCNRKAVEAADVKLVLLPKYAPPRVKGALEGEELRILERTGDPAPQAIEACSNEEHLWWRGAKPGDKLVLGFPAPAAGKYHVIVRCLKAGDYGIVQLSVNDQKAGDPIDFYNNGIKPTDEIKLGTFELTSGENRLTAEVTGANEKAQKGYMFGLDYIRLEPAQ